jgi:hypothetical protein
MLSSARLSSTAKLEERSSYMYTLARAAIIINPAFGAASQPEDMKRDPDSKKYQRGL